MTTAETKTTEITQTAGYKEAMDGRIYGINY